MKGAKKIKQRKKGKTKAFGKFALSVIIIFSVISLLYATEPVYAAASVVFDAASSAGQYDYTARTLSWSHTTSGSKRALVVSVVYPSGVWWEMDITATYAGVSLTEIANIGEAGHGGTWMGYLLNPASGTNTVTFTTTSDERLYAGAVSLKNVDSLYASASDTHLGGPIQPSVTVSSGDGHMVVDGGSFDPGTLTVGSGQTKRWERAFGPTWWRGAGSTEPKSGSGSVTMSWTMETPDDWELIAADFAPVECVDNTDCGTCQKCVSYSCTYQTSSEDLKNECGTTSCYTGNCNGAGACGIYSGGQKGSCGTCYYCNDGDSACDLVGSGSDPTGDCALGSWSCDGSCRLQRNSGNCNGAGACLTNDEKSNCGSGTACSAGSCGAANYCDGTDHCSGNTRYTGYTCNGANTCNVDKGDIGCCQHSKCAASQYCSASWACTGLSTCGERTGTDTGQDPQEDGEDQQNECTASYTTCDNQYTRRGGDSFCAGGSYACDTDDASTAVSAGYVCQSGNNVNPSGNSNCGTGAQACYCNNNYYQCDIANDCTYDRYYVGFNAGPSCTETNKQLRDGDIVNPAGYRCNVGSTTAYASYTSIMDTSRCSETDHCTGNTIYTGYTCNAGSCATDNTDIGCCQHSKCTSTQYCSGTYACTALSTCGERTGTDTGQDPQESNEDLRSECGTTDCYTGNCNGASYACGVYSGGEQGSCSSCYTCNDADAACDDVTSKSSDWNINCADNCIISSNVNMNGYNLLFSNSGTFTANANLLNWNQIKVSDGCTVKITASSYFQS